MTIKDFNKKPMKVEVPGEADRAMMTSGGRTDIDT